MEELRAVDDVPYMMRELLRDLAKRSPILGATIVSMEGLPLFSYLNTGSDEAAIAVLVSSAYSAGLQTVKELKQGHLKSVIIEGDAGTTLILAISESHLLTVIAPENAKLGLVFNDAKQVGRRAARLLQDMEPI
ncbi:MAG: roadblock/LC7 domain-containing protein [Candidatus Thorarchaeota archaeon]|nr:roadblock/LC7 domain-containing protein [Candidatus Thorarchaeota archaeon]